MKCCLCSGEIEKRMDWEKGNNALPIEDGRCCDVCNETKVLPERIRRMVLSREGK